MASQDWFDKDFYALLGVSADADAKEIKAKYRKLARTHHPDSNPGDAAAEQRFKDIGEAYAVLSDPEQRKQYDAVRAMARGGARFTAGGAGGPGAGAGFEDVFSTIFNSGGGTRFTTGGYGGRPGEEPDLEDLLNMFGQGAGGFGNGGQYGAPGGRPGGFGGGGFSRPKKGRDLHATAGLSFRQAVEGDTVVVNGVGAGKPITARIPPGIKDGATIRLPGKGEPGPGGTPPGDILLKVTVHPHEVFTRDGDNLRIEVPVTFAEAALGETISVPTLSGDAVKVKLPAGIASGKTLRVKGRGVRRKGHNGDMLVKVLVTVPQRLTDEARAAVEALRNQEAGLDPREEIFRKARA